MARASRRVAEQHEDWLKLADPTEPWFSLPVLKRAFPQGLDPTPADIRAEHKLRWQGSEGIAAARTVDHRHDYVDWLLRDALDWGDAYLAGSDLPTGIAAGVSRHGVTIAPTGVLAPPVSRPLELFEDLGDAEDEAGGAGASGGDERARVLVFVFPAGTDPRARPPGDGWPATWVQRAALACRHTGVRLALLTDGDHLVLVNAPVGGATGWGSWRASEFAAEPVLLDSFRSMLHVRCFVAFEDKDTPEALLEQSAATQGEVVDQLGSQVRRATELLVNAISRANLDREGALLDGVGPHRAYEAAVTVMMRLVILLVAEERNLLPVDDPHYQRLFSVRTLHKALEDEKYENPEALESRTTAWHRLLATSRAVHGGVRHNELQVPAYGGNLFDPDRFPFLEGRRPGGTWRTEPSTPIPVTDLDVLAILDALLVLRFRSASGVMDTRRLSYRQVSVEQVGHVYERLLDHDAFVADEVVLGLRRLSGTDRNVQEPERPLRELEAKRIDGEGELIAYLSDKDGRRGGCYTGTPKQVAKALEDSVGPHLRGGLLEACQGDVSLARRIEPYAHLLRLDLRGRPTVFLPGALYVRETGTRRATGTSYTTKELADELVEHALAPLCYSPGPQDTTDTNAWRIRPSGELLGLKVCDPAVGSGAILAAACRYLAERLIEAWRAEGDPRAIEMATAADDPEQLDVVVEAHRLVAERCCYGVDRNPMAADLAQASMWITTWAKNRPFTFLEHALKAGDSLLGIWDLDQLRYLHYDPQAGRDRTVPVANWDSGGEAFETVERLLDEALALRRQVADIDTRSPADAELKLKLHRESEERLAVLGTIADLVSGAALSTADTNSRERSISGLTQRFDTDAELVDAVVNAPDPRCETVALAEASARARLRLDAGRPEDAPRREPFHWPVAFPEVFTAERQGFDAMIGNPPFMGGQRITGSAGNDYRDHLVQWMADGHRGSADLVSYFFLYTTRLARGLGFLATNTIGQGSTSEVGLAQMIDRGWTIYRAVSSTTWPGDNSLEIAKVWMSSETWLGECVLDGRAVVGIDEMLYPKPRSGWRKQQLVANKDKSFQGSIVLGLGFTMSPEEARALIAKDPRNADVLFPYLGGEDLYESPTQTAPRWVINFFDWPKERAQEYPDCFAIVEEKVKPQRSKNKRKPRREYWWRYAEPAPKLYRTIEDLDRVLAVSRVSNTAQPVFVHAGQVLSEATVVFAIDDYEGFGILNSTFHYVWVVRYASSLRTDIRYTPSDVFETFPLPDEIRLRDSGVAEVAEELDTHRSELMVRNDEGLTKTYNRVHDPDERDPDIQKLRSLHRWLDEAVRDAYGWDDLENLGHGFHEVRGQGVRFTFAPEVADEILDRLLELNKERYEAEVRAGLHDKKKPRAKPATRTPRKPSPNQGTLL